MVDGNRLTFEVFGLLQGVLTMINRETGSVWTHLDGKAIQGGLEGERMTFIPLIHITWGEWKAAHPRTMVLSPDTPFQDRYGPVRIGVFNQREADFGDDRQAANALVVGVEVGGQFKGYPLEELQKAGGVVNDMLAGQPLVVIYDDNARVGLAYSRVTGDLALEFYNSGVQGFELRDRQTESVWDQQGRALSGAMAGTSLEFVPSFISEWYGWSGYHPETTLFDWGG